MYLDTFDQKYKQNYNMPGKITLITPPDIFENNNESVLFMHLSEEEQDTVSRWLGETGLQDDINFYVYSGEDNPNWLFYALALCKHKYINIDYYNSITQALSGYILGKGNVHYQVSNPDLANIYSHINNNRVENIEKFLEIKFGDNKPTQ